MWGMGWRLSPWYVTVFLGKHMNECQGLKTEMRYVNH